MSNTLAYFPPRRSYYPPSPDLWSVQLSSFNNILESSMTANKIALEALVEQSNQRAESAALSAEEERARYCRHREGSTMQLSFHVFVLSLWNYMPLLHWFSKIASVPTYPHPIQHHHVQT